MEHIKPPPYWQAGRQGSPSVTRTLSTMLADAQHQIPLMKTPGMRRGQRETRGVTGSTKSATVSCITHPCSEQSSVQ